MLMANAVLDMYATNEMAVNVMDSEDLKNKKRGQK